MPKFTVRIREVHVSHREVEAETVEEAIELAGGAEESFLEYSHTLGEDHWDVQDEDGNIVRDQYENTKELS